MYYLFTFSVLIYRALIIVKANKQNVIEESVKIGCHKIADRFIGKTIKELIADLEDGGTIYLSIKKEKFEDIETYIPTEFKLINK